MPPAGSTGGSSGMHLEATGHSDAPPITLIHGALVDSRGWHLQVSALERDMRVITVDLPGYGRKASAKPTWSIPQLGSEIWDGLDQLGVSFSFLAGFSFGGFIAQEMATAHPQRVRGLILVGSAIEPAASARPAFAERGREAASAPTEEIAAAHIERVFSARFRLDHPDLTAEYARWITQTDRASIAHTFQEISGYRPTRPIEDFNGPVLVIAGSEDAAVPPRGSAELSSRLPHSRLEIFPGAGHNVHLESGDRFNHLIRRFVRSVEDLEVGRPGAAGGHGKRKD